ncbi:hypothetical protein BST61_g8428 [Cercospora zeina]
MLYRDRQLQIQTSSSLPGRLQLDPRTQKATTMSTMKAVFEAYQQRQAALEATYSTNPYARGIAYISNEIVPLYSARVPLVDQGFLKGDLTYDVASTWNGRFFRLNDHLDRLDR